MKSFIDSYGENAGKIWTTLNTYGPLNETNLIEKTKLTKNNFYAAIGWLARENKVYRDGNNFYLGKTNLTNTIGKNAGKIYKTLYTTKEADVSFISNKIKTTEKEIFYALGWLARENKIYIWQGKNRFDHKIKLI